MQQVGSRIETGGDSGGPGFQKGQRCGLSPFDDIADDGTAEARAAPASVNGCNAAPAPAAPAAPTPAFTIGCPSYEEVTAARADGWAGRR